MDAQDPGYAELYCRIGQHEYQDDTCTHCGRKSLMDDSVLLLALDTDPSVLPSD